MYGVFGSLTSCLQLTQRDQPADLGEPPVTLPTVSTISALFVMLAVVNIKLSQPTHLSNGALPTLLFTAFRKTDSSIVWCNLTLFQSRLGLISLT